MRALIEDGLPGANIAQVGLASFANSRAMHDDAVAAGNLVITIGDVRRDGHRARDRPRARPCRALRRAGVDCDIDVIDRAQFPAAPGARPGGMAAHDFFAAVRRLASDPRVRVIDLTEWDPPLDPTDLSALTAARWVAECLAGLRDALSRRRCAGPVGQGPEGDREAQAARPGAMLCSQSWRASPDSR